MKKGTSQTITLGTRRLDYRLLNSRKARTLRVRVGPNGVEVLKPAIRQAEDVAKFLHRNEPWILNQLGRIDRLGQVRRNKSRGHGQILFRGEATNVRVETVADRRRENRVFIRRGEIVIQRGPRSKTPTSRSLENWLRKQAKDEIQRCLAVLVPKLKQKPNRLYVMNQRTKWGNCSARRNLSFNWRLILAPREALQYLVAHEATHLAVPDHSDRFWLLLQSICPHARRSRLWLAEHGHTLFSDSAAVAK